MLSRRLVWLLAVLALVGARAQLLCGDSYIITLDRAAREQPANGRVVLFFMTRHGSLWDQQDPIEGPFFEAPQPIASIAVADFKPGESVTIDGSAPAFPEPLNALDGPVRVQAILDADQTERSHDAGPGNVFSEVLSVELSATRDETIRLTLNHRVEQREKRERANLRWIKVRSELLSKFHGREVHHRAGVALPKGYDDPQHPRQQWPAIYVVPGYGGRDESARHYSDMLGTGGVEEIAPMGLYIVLDPEAPLGHHGFVDSPCNGPVETALLTELIPHLESQFRLVPKPEARIITGHSSGGWTSLWLALHHPGVFGACWSSSPDPVDFTAFQMTDIYRDSNMYVDRQGEATPSYRGGRNMRGEMRVLMTVRQECGMESAIDPDGRSGQQWDAWEAMFSPADPAPQRAGLPQRLFDRATGQVSRAVAEHWAKFDIARLVEGDWQRFGPILRNNVRLACGEADSFYLNRAVQRLKEKIEARAANGEAPEGGGGAGGGGGVEGGGYVLMVERADHETITPRIFQRWNKEMRQHLQAHGLQEAD